jgi:hypothetical protein
MKITDIIRGILDHVDSVVAQPGPEPQEPEMVIAVPAEAPCEPDQGSDLLAIIQQLAGIPAAPDYANEPVEAIAQLGAAFPGGDDMHNRKNPADIRTNAPSMYPGFQAGGQ